MSAQKNQPRFVSIEQLSSGQGGGKASGLAELARLGLSVPPALVVLDAEKDNLPVGISEAWLAKNGGLAAVRSSGSDEDGEGASAAGQFETFLNVDPENLDDAVSRCIASAESERVQAYEHELSGTECQSMSVVIQKMVQPSRAGVIFTADPISGNRDVMIVEAVAGMGEELVSGHAEAARYVLSMPNADNKLVAEASGNLADAELDDSLLENLRAGAALAVADLGMPLDLEWAVDKETGELHWLQARPITALADSLDSIIDEKTLVTRCNIGEMMPGAVTPITHSLVGKSLSTGLAMYYKSFGGIPRGENPCFVESFEDQLFMNFTNMYWMGRRVLGATPEGTELGVLGYVLSDRDTGGPMAPFPLRFINGIRYFSMVFQWKKALKKLEKITEKARFETEGKDAASLLADIKAAHGPILDEAVFRHYGGSAFSGAMNAALAITLSGGNDITDEANRLLTELLSGVEGVESAAVLEGLEELAGIISKRGSLRILEGDEVLSVHRALLENDTEIGDYYRSFIKRHGHRCIREAEFHEPEWAMEPGHLIESLRALIDAPPRPPAPEAAAVEDLDLPEGVNQKAVAWIAKQARQGVWVREKSKSLLIKVTHEFKLAIRAMAEKIEKEGFIPEADLAYFLTMDELESLLAGDGQGLIGRALRRRRRYPERQEIRFPDLSFGRPVPETPPLPEDGDNLMGTPVSRGIVEGIVRVVKSREDAEALQKGEIMVAQFTDIGWTPFYGRVSGMITEIGGALSHGSVVAREYGLPLVGSLTGACTVLKDGMKVRIDGGIGVVTILDGEREAEPVRA